MPEMCVFMCCVVCLSVVQAMPSIIWVLPIVGFIGVGIAITAYCVLGT